MEKNRELIVKVLRYCSDAGNDCKDCPVGGCEGRVRCDEIKRAAADLIEQTHPAVRQETYISQLEEESQHLRQTLRFMEGQLHTYEHIVEAWRLSRG